MVKLTPEFKLEFDFGQNDNRTDGGGEEVDFTGKESVGKCPKCGARVFENGMNYVCEKAVGPVRTCDFRSGAIILQQPVDKTQISRLLSVGKTELLPKFISKKTGRPFKAFLAGQDGKITLSSSRARQAKGVGSHPGTCSQNRFHGTGTAGQVSKMWC